MQAVTVFFPIYEAYTTSHLSQATLAALREWENRGGWDDPAAQSQSGFTSKTTTSDQSRTFHMSALEKQLIDDPTALLHFAATRDFTAENIIFLVAVRDWKMRWGDELTRGGRNAGMFEQAVEIYANSISEKIAEFPINIEGVIRTKLDAVFADAVSNVRARQTDPFNEVTPFATPAAVPLSPLKSPSSAGTGSARSMVKEMYDESSVVDGVAGAEGVDFRVFDAAEKSIKYLVLTNTWRKYINEERSSRSSSEVFK